jgi:hypothetical protein
MPVGKAHQVLCASCREAVTTEYAYPEHRCGYTSVTQRAEDGRFMQVSCTSRPGNKDCARGVHYDKFLFAKFETRKGLRSSREGNTGRILQRKDSSWDTSFTPGPYRPQTRLLPS